MGIRSSFPKIREYQILISQFQLLQDNQPQNIKYLQHKQTQKEYLLKQLTFYQQQDFKKNYNYFNKCKDIYQNNQHLLKIKRIIIDKKEGMLINIYKIYLLVEYPQRTLDDQINQRALQRRSFDQEQLLCILASCVLGLNHLQKNQISHRCLKSSSILIAQDDIIKIYDPQIIKAQKNYIKLMQEQHTPHLYLSPEEMQALKTQTIRNDIQSSKHDVWTLAMIILEAGLLTYQDNCYRNNYSKFDWIVLKKNLNIFQQHYSKQLGNLLRFMLNKDYRVRPFWQQIQAHVTKIQSDNKHIQIANNSQIKLTSKINEKIGPPKKRIFYDSNFENHKKDRTGSLIIDQGSKANTPQLYTIESKVSKRSSNVKQLSQKFKLSSNINQNYVTISQISKNRPLKSLFPTNNYKTLTSIDQNVYINTKTKRKQSQIFSLQPLDISHPYYEHHNDLNQSKSEHNSHNTNLFLNKSINGFFHDSPVYNNVELNKIESNEKKQIKSNSYVHSMAQNEIIHPKGVGQTKFIVETYKQGSRYEGYMMNGLRHGYGKFYYQDGGYYDGTWHFGKMNGRGKLYYQSLKLAYDGQWKDDQFHGYGHFYNQNPHLLNHYFDFTNFDGILQFWTKYEGQFINDIKHGKGTIYLSNGQSYSGHFFNDLINGQGIFQTLDGRRIHSHWSNNHII